MAGTFYQLDGGVLTTYSAPFAVSTTGTHTVLFHSKDKAGNVESTKSVSFTIKASTTTSISSSKNPSAYHQSVTFTAKVTDSFGATPTGTVTFKNGAASLGAVALSGGVATLTTSALAVGSHSITASYAGSGKNLASTSSALTQTVNKASTTTTLKSSVDPASFHQAVTFTATVSGAFGGSTAGTVTFKNGTAVLGTGTLNASGVATFSTGGLTVGIHSITATYGGNGNFLSSASSPLAQTVNKASTTTTLVSSLNPSTRGQTVTFTATVTGTFGRFAVGNGNVQERNDHHRHRGCQHHDA